MAISAGVGEEATSGSGVRNSSSSKSRPLSHPDDSTKLSRLLCFVRLELVEAFVISTDEEARACRNVDCRRKRDPSEANEVAVCGGEQTKTASEGGEWETFYGRVGVRCVHCAANNASSTSRGRPQKAKGAARGAVSFPPSIRLVYQSVRNWLRYHAGTCPSMPQDVKEKYLVLKAATAARLDKSGVGVATYWEKSCLQMGMIDAGDGIRLRDGRFLDNAPEEKALGTLTCEGIESVLPSSGTSTEEKELAMTDIVCQRFPAPGSYERGDKDQSHRTRSEEFQSNGQMEHSSSETLSQLFTRSAFDPNISKSTKAGETSMALRGDGNPLLASIQEEDWKSSSPGLQAIFPNEPHAADLELLQIDPESISTAAERGGSLSLWSEQWTSGNTLPAPLSNAILEKVNLAKSVVQAVGRVDGEFAWGKESDGFDMVCLGEELYELFAGRNPFLGKEEEKDLDMLEGKDPTDDVILEPEKEGPQQCLKREKLREKRQYVPLSDMGLPPPLCTLISALLDTENEGRRNAYKSVQDVEEDLRLMAERPDRFLFQPANGCLQTASTVLFGREKEVARLLEAYDETTHSASVGRNRMVLVAGYSGTGKSSLVHSVRDRLIEKGAHFISGKFDTMRQLGPFTAIVSALDDYCDMLSRDSDRIGHVREAVKSGIEEHGMAVLANLIPNIGKIVETAVDGPPGRILIGGGEVTQRVVFLFRMLLRATCSRAHPVVLFLDDLQWADELSLELLQALIVDVVIEGLLVIGCYRNNEVNGDHLLTAYLDNIRTSKNVDIVPIQVSNLDLESVNALVSEILCTTPRMAWQLAKAVLHKTGGNALFVVQFLGSLHDENLLRFSLMSQQWEWDIEKIRCKSIADNVVELMTGKMLRLAPEVQQALKIAAAFGAQCQEEIFQILDRAPDRVVSSIAALDVAVAEGLVVKTGSAYRFSHDQIQHAAYLLIPEFNGEEFHLKVGRWLWQWSSAEEMDTYLFVVVDQLHRGSRLITDHDEQINLARLSLLAGQKASGVYAFLPAATFLKAGIDLLVEEDWIVHRDLCFNLYNSAAETEFILREFDVMETHWDEVLRRANTLQEKLRAYYALVQSHGSQGNAKECIGTAMTVLKQLGEPFPETVTKLTVMTELIETQFLISRKTEDALFGFELMKDERKREAMKFLDHIVFPLLLQRHEYFPSVACRMVRLSLKYGVCSESACGFACYGMVLSGPLKDLSGGYHLGKLALSIHKKFQDKENLARVHLFVHGFINNWVEPIQSSLPFLKDAIRVGLATGNVECGAAAALLYLKSALFAGECLVPLMEEMKSLSALMPRYQLYMPQAMSKPVQQAMLNLLGQSDDPIKFCRDENDCFHAPINAQDEGSQFSAPDTLAKLYRMWLEYLFGEYELAWETKEDSQDIEKLGGVSARFPEACNFSFYSGLTAIAMARNEGESKYADTIHRTLKKMEVWAASTPWNCRHKLELMNAEYAYLKRDFLGAAEAYSVAIDTAAKHKFIHEEALASERAALFYSETGEHDAASNMFMRAFNCYNEWGASSKAAHVQQQHDF